MSFFKVEDGELLEAPNFVLNAAYELRAEDHTTYTYPVDGWRWFDERIDASAFYGLEPGEPLAARVAVVESAVDTLILDALGGSNV